MSHFNEHNILTVKQHGFRKRRSCVTQLVTTIQGIASQLCSGRDQVDVILLDFAKAFDKVPHQLFSTNSATMELEVMQWVQSFLRQRTQQVLLDGSCSSQADVISGVPQGTVLGPCYSWPSSTTCQMLSNTQIPASSQMTVSCTDSSKDDDVRKLQEDLDALEEWESKWQMKFHPEKCQVIRINLKRRFERHSTYRLHGHLLEGLTVESI